ncbi:MAG: restriction endonuclease, partial [Gemmatimonadota bacterium]|nr:restriction endonuclease [Gemmatimonadota bacterium]
MVYPDKNAIKRSGLTIYDHIPAERPDLYIASKKLEKILKESLIGISLSGLALRTRSKVVKTDVCKAIGYPVPGSFKRTQPRFPGQNFDVYIQKSNNLQIWNEELDASRRYVIVRVDEDNRIGNVRVIAGAELAKLDRTGTLTQKYQATLDVGAEACELVSREDAIPAERIGQESSARLIDPTEDPSLRSLIPIQTLFGILKCT